MHTVVEVYNVKRKHVWHAVVTYMHLCFSQGFAPLKIAGTLRLEKWYIFDQNETTRAFE